MKRIFFLIIFLLCLTSMVYGMEGTRSFPIKMTDCSGIIDEGVCCWDTDDDLLCCGSGTTCVVQSSSGATGDVTSVGDCASGACNDGSSDGGTYIRLYDGTSAYTGITAGVRTLTFAPSNTNAENMVMTFGNNNNSVDLSSGTGAVVNISGNAATATLATAATALAANGANCSSGQAPLGVDASGAVEGCFAVDTGTLGQLTAGTMTDTKYCIYTSSGNQIVCNSTGGSGLVVADIDTSAEIAAIVTDETGSASGTPLLMFNQNPTVAGLTNTGQILTSYTSVASTPAEIMTGTWYSGGSATTTKPYFLIEPTGTASTAWSTSGTGLGINAASGFAGDLFDFQIAGVSRFRLTQSYLYYLNSSGAGIYLTPGQFSMVNLSGYVFYLGSTNWNTSGAYRYDVDSNTNTSGVTYFMKVLPQYNQASGSAENTDLYFRRTETAIGSGLQRLWDFGVGTNSAMALTNKGHIIVGAGITGSYPTLTNCDTTPVLATGSTDFAGTFTIDTTGTGCTITFGTAYTNTPSCIVVAQISSNMTSYTLSASAITVVGLPGIFNYNCVGINGGK